MRPRVKEGGEAIAESMPSCQAPAAPARNDSVEAFRVIAVLAVIIIHTKPFMRDLFPSPQYRLLEYLFNQPPRFAVPFFFVTAGYFLGRKAQCDPKRRIRIKNYLLRLVGVVAGWSLLYIALPSFWPPLLAQGYRQVTVQKIAPLLASPLTLLLEGGKVHLWFIPSLIMGVALLALCTSNGRIWLACLASGFLFAFGLLGASYSVTPLGIHAPFFTRNGPFLSLICLTTGYVMSLRRPPFPLGMAWAIAGGGMALHIFETWLLWRCYAVPMINHDYLVGTVVCGAGLLMVALAAPSLGRRTGLHALGKYTLGVYASHFLFIDLLGPLTYLFELHLWQFLLPLLVYLLSLACSALLLRSPRLRWLV